MMWRASASVADFLPDFIRKRVLEYAKVMSGKKEYAPRWKECSATTAHYLSLATSSLYVREFLDEQSKDVATEMVTAFKDEFEKILETVPWMDDATRAAALCKVKKMKQHVGYPNELMDDKKLIEFYKDVKLFEHEYLKSVLSMNLFRIASDMKKLRLPLNKTDWETHSDVAVANAYYSWNENSICESFVAESSI